MVYGREGEIKTNQNRESFVACMHSDYIGSRYVCKEMAKGIIVVSLQEEEKTKPIKDTTSMILSF